MYADDTVLVVSHMDLDAAVRYLQSDYNRIHQYNHDSGFIENKNKAKLMYIRSPHKNPSGGIPVKSHNLHCLHFNLPAKTAILKKLSLQMNMFI